MRRIWVSVLAACVYGQSCSPALPPTRNDSVGASGVPAPPAEPSLAQAPPELSAPPETPGPETETEAGDAPVLSSFTPLLAAPGLELAADAVAAEDFTTAVAQVAAYITRQRPRDVEESRWRLLLASLREKAGDTAGAIEDYERASASAWPLTDYAALGLGRCLTDLGELERAKAALERVPATSGAIGSARALLAEVECRLGDAPKCLEQLQKLATGPRKPPGWSTQAFRVVDMLVKELATPRAQQAAIDAQVSALDLIRTLTRLAPGSAHRFEVAQLERALLAVLPVNVRKAKAELPHADRLALAQAMEAAGRNEDADGVAGALLEDLGPGAYGPIACQARLVQAKALNDLKQRERAQARFIDVARHCKADDVRAWSLYFAGKYAFSDKRYAESDRLFAELERELPRHRLADDARWYRAQAQLELGDDARFVQLLERIDHDYPKGDLTIDGMFALALRRMEKGDWKTAAGVLDRSVQRVDNDVRRGQECSGRERYFQARALIETGQVERGLAQYEQLIAELPLSYYTLHAYSRLQERDPARAEQVLSAVMAREESTPFRIPRRPEFEQPGFLRALELLRQGDIDSARRELDAMNLFADPAPQVLWGLATLYARVGSARHSHALPRWEMVDWLEHWPTSSWKRAWELAYPRPHIEAVTLEAKRQGVEPALVYAVMREESAFDASAVSSANAYGLMQIISPTARAHAKPAGLPYDRRALTTPEISIALGSRVLASYRDRFFRDDPLLTIPGYNAGPGRPMRWAKDWPSVDFDVWVELIPFRETRRYTKRVLASRASYGFLYYRSPEFDPLRLPRRLNSSASASD